MGWDIGTWLAIGSVASGVAGIGSMIAGRPSMPAPPPPASYYSYDDEGVQTIQVWDEEKNAYITKRDPEPEFTEKKPEKGTTSKWVESGDGGYYEDVPESDEEYNARLRDWEARRDAWRAESEEWQEWNKRQIEREEDRTLRKELRAKMLSNLNQTPEDRVAAYDEYAKNFAESMSKHIDKQYSDAERSIRESMSARGLTGSRADVDLQAELARGKLESDADIALKSEMAKEQLAQADRDYWLRAVAELDAGSRADAALALQRQHAAMQGAAQGTSTLMGRYAAEQANAAQRLQHRMQLGQNLLGTSVGLAYLYSRHGKKADTPLTSYTGYQAPRLDYNRPSWLY